MMPEDISSDNHNKIIYVFIYFWYLYRVAHITNLVVFHEALFGKNKTNNSSKNKIYK